MDPIIVRLNIELLNSQLETETDENKRRMLVRLLSETQRDLVAISQISTAKIGIRSSVSDLAKHPEV